ncbi:hypothetical protein [Candidatus Thiodictyon syntrophicum]|uniref:Uncharacterized protein n=1 Tax=Candidatus Thiodictyon syntrophicum TaxID=1166950 RepID=A0A2K8U9E0_9GAMM|nr:hypothetical protein [Candidatus Thiodictyon syntrophicum]AUB82183.1 hypothetical protein THSYN_15325 [Candidatus Thiodictyon syntrophicum]
MSNLFLPARFSERIHRLALGVEPLDAAGGARLGHPIQILVEPPAPGLPRPRLVRHLSGLFVMVQDPGVPTTLTLRLCDLGAPKDVPGFQARTNRRRLVPRRLRVTIPAADLADTLPLAQRARRPALFPGAAYAVTDSVTGLRGRVERAGVPVRWARVEARRPGAGPADPPVGRAHGDDRGEFLLLVESNAAPMTTLERPFELDLVAYPPIPPAPCRRGPCATRTGSGTCRWRPCPRPVPRTRWPRAPFHPRAGAPPRPRCASCWSTAGC